MPKLPVISGKELVRILELYGFRIVRKRGSHVFLRHKIHNVSTVVPVHSNEDLGKGLLRSILNDLEIEIDDFLLMLKKKQSGVESLRLDRHYLH